MKAVLFALNSSYVHTNLAVRCLKNHVDTKYPGKHEIIIVEKNLKDKTDEVLYTLYSLNAEIYGFSCYIFNINEMLFYAQNLKKLLPEVKILFGGPEASYDSKYLVERNPFIDNVITQEGEDAFENYLEKIPDKQIITGKSYSKFYQKGIEYDEDNGINGNIAYYESSRGCPYKCSYCLSSIEKGIRSKSAIKTLEDILEYEKFKSISIIKFVDRTFNYDIDRANEILKGLLDEKYTKTYHLEVRPELFNNEMFDILKKFPNNKLQMEIGIQSTNKKTLEAIDRPSNIDNAIKNMKKLRALGNIKVHGDLIFGLSYDDIFYACDELQLGVLKLLKGTKIRNQEKEFSYVFNNEPPYDIFSNRFLSYENVFILKRIAALTERYKNSIHFHNSCEYIIGYFKSPFNFFVGLNKFINYHISTVSQHEAFRKFYEYSSKFVKCYMKEQEWSIFIQHLKKDYLVCLNRNAPDYFI